MPGGEFFAPVVISSIFYFHPDPCRNDPIRRAYFSDVFVLFRTKNRTPMSTWPLAMTCGSQRFAAGRGGWEIFWTNKSRPAPTAGCFFFEAWIIWRGSWSHQDFPMNFMMCFPFFFVLQFFVLPPSFFFFWESAKKQTKAKFHGNCGGELVNVFTFLTAGRSNKTGCLGGHQGGLLAGWHRHEHGGQLPEPPRDHRTWSPHPRRLGFDSEKKVDQGVFEMKKPNKPCGKFTAFDSSKNGGWV